MSTANPAFPNKTPSSKSPVPPEEQFWQRYSPHYEFPLSTVTSVAIHVLVLVLLFFVGKYLFEKLSGSKKPLQEIGVVVVGGGGGNPQGEGPGPGGELKDLPAEETGDKPQEATPTPELPKRETLNPSLPITQILPEVKDDSVRQLIQSGNDAVKPLARINKDAQDKLRRGITGHGEGGPGSGGGKDRGRDTGKGDLTGPGDANVRLKRTLRWVMVFDTFNGDDYARQLAGLGAILAIPLGNNEYGVIHDLNRRPARPHPEDLEQIKRIYWIDEKRESITPLCMALSIKPVPDHIVAFFPEKLEKKLLQIELRYKGLREDQIYETRFKVRKTASGYEPVVIDQKAN